MTNVSPRQGSLQGGTKVTITGVGFSSDLAANSVMFGEVPCTVESATQSVIICVMGNSGKVHQVTNQGEDAGDDF